MKIDWTNVSVLITGGSGSFGRAMTRLLLETHSLKRLVIFSRGEVKQLRMRREFGDNPALRFFIGDVRDLERLRLALRGVDIVFHAAALKQVPVAEYNPFEAIQTNILGAANVIRACIDAGVKRIIGLSSDKAVNPINLYGATKLCADKLFVAANSYAGALNTRFAVVRYGNVVGSRGSVIPLFMEQRRTGVVPITDERMTRFWITLEQAVRFTLKCIELMCGGEIFVPKIPSMRIVDLAKAVAPDCRCKIIGIRPGEKLHETLVSEDDARTTVQYDGYFMIQPYHCMWSDLGYSGPRGGETCPDGFRYSSDKNDCWLSGQELREMLEGKQIVSEPGPVEKESHAAAKGRAFLGAGTSHPG